MSRIVIAGAFDSKAVPLGLLIDMLRERGEDPIIIDTSVFSGDPAVTYPARDVAAHAGCKHEELPARGRAEAVAVMSKGAAAILSGLADKGEVGALVCMGGSNGTMVFSHLAPVLPLGIPKILMATAVAGDTRPIMGASDVVMMYPVVDVDGQNAVLHRMLERLADIAAAIKTNRPLGQETRARKAVALSMYGVTTPCVQRASELLDQIGFEPIVFHANGTGGRSIEDLAAQKIVDGIIDATIAELGAELLGGAFPTGPDRMTSAARHGVPQVIAPGAIDTIAFGARSTVPEKYEDHKIVAHNELVTLVRTTPDECRAIGVRLAERLDRPKTRAVVCIPLGGTSMLDKAGAVFHDPDAVAAFRDGFKENARPGIGVVQSSHNINDPDFADLLVAELQSLMGEEARG